VRELGKIVSSLKENRPDTSCSCRIDKSESFSLAVTTPAIDDQRGTPDARSCTHVWHRPRDKSPHLTTEEQASRDNTAEERRPQHHQTDSARTALPVM
jgi:hypothetical protein